MATESDLRELSFPQRFKFQMGSKSIYEVVKSDDDAIKYKKVKHNSVGINSRDVFIYHKQWVEQKVFVQK